MKTIKLWLPLTLLALTCLPSAMPAEEEVHNTRLFVGKAANRSTPRDYRTAVSANEKKDLRYIMRTLATSSLLKISWNTAALKKAGDRIDHLHPFKFLEAIFTDEEMRGYARQLQGKSWVWKEFLDGITTSLAKENASNNLKAHMQEFAERVNVDAQTIKPLVAKQRWKDIVNTLIAQTHK